MRRTLSRAVQASITLLAVVTAAVAFEATKASASPGPCAVAPGSDYCVGGQTRPTSRPPTRPVRPTGSTSSSSPPACGWTTVTEAEARPWVTTPPPAGTAVVWQAYCIDAPSAGSTYGGPYRWVDAAAPPTPAEIAAGLYEQIQGRMPYPVVVTNPPLGVPSVIEVPVFVTVTNWQSSISVSDAVAGVAVTVTATPQLLFKPGEPGSAVKSCAGPGRRYDPGADLWAQAESAEACAHVYMQRTGAEGRPATWPATVTVRWTITWAAGDGSGGSFPTVDRVTAVPRAVEEVQTVVVAGG